jgi:hypothetical protein
VSVATESKTVAEKKVGNVSLQLLDAGERSLNKYDHIQKACIEGCDVAVAVFSLADRCVCCKASRPLMATGRVGMIFLR